MTDISRTAQSAHTAVSHPTGPSASAAGASAYLALLFLLLGAGALTIYFGSGEVGNPFGTISDVLFVGFAVFLGPPVLAIRRIVDGREGRWFDLVSWTAIAGLAICGGGQALLVAGLIPLEVSFITFSGGMALFLLWGVALWSPAVRHGFLPGSTARWALASVILLALATVAWFGFPTEVGYAAVSALGVAMIGWLVSLARTLRRMA